MPGSIRASATSERVAAEWRASPRARRVLTTPAVAIGVAIALAWVLVAALAPAIAPADPFASVAAPLSAPGRGQLFGTDDLGRDVLAGVVHGARTSLLVVAAVTALSTLIGVGVGAAAGSRPGAVDDLLMRATELVQVMPRFFLAVIVIALFGPGLDRLALVLGLTSWPGLARVVRAETLSIGRREFVEAARALGAASPRILLRHVLPHALPAATVVISLNAAGVILLEAGLGFIGLGDPKAMSWGYLANNAQRFLRVAWWMAAFPGAAIALAVLGLNLLGDAVNDWRRPARDQRPAGAPSRR